MKSLTEIEPETTVTINTIQGGLENKKHLENLGVKEGIKLTVVSTEPVHEHIGPIALKIKNQELTIARGWADKIYVEKNGGILPLLQLEKADKGVVKSIEGGKDSKNLLSELGIEEGSELTFLNHIPDKTLVFKSGDKELRMGEGQASKVLVESKSGSIQINYLKEGEPAKITKIIGGKHLKEKFEQTGITVGNEIILNKKEDSVPISRKGNYILANVNGQLITIGHGLAEKVMIE